VLHLAAYRALGLNWTYEAIDCGVEELPAVLADRAEWAGFSATMPLKHALLGVAAEVGERAASVGAANTLLAGRDGWIADNTDAYGIGTALTEHDVWPGSATLLGAGGTAQAALAALSDRGMDECTVLVRNAMRADALLATAARLGIRLSVATLDADHPALAADLVVSTLPPRAGDRYAARRWRSDQAVLDVVYRPWPTALAAAASEGGATVVSGALMLLHQAAEQVRLMTGRDAPVEAMRAALRVAAPNSGT
jgi:shikimate dehydrogenase